MSGSIRSHPHRLVLNLLFWYLMFKYRLCSTTERLFISSKRPSKAQRWRLYLEPSLCQPFLWSSLIFLWPRLNSLMPGTKNLDALADHTHLCIRFNMLWGKPESTTTASIVMIAMGQRTKQTLSDDIFGGSSSTKCASPVRSTPALHSLVSASFKDVNL